MSEERSREPRASQQRMLELRRAEAAWTYVSNTKGSNYAKDYGQLARSAPADIQVNGLGQTLAFWRAKGSKDGRPKDGGNNAHWKLQEHVSAWVLSEVHIQHAGGFMGWIMAECTGVDDYRRATAEALAFLVWLKRFAEAELG